MKKAELEKMVIERLEKLEKAIIKYKRGDCFKALTRHERATVELIFNSYNINKALYLEVTGVSYESNKDKRKN